MNDTSDPHAAPTSMPSSGMNGGDPSSPGGPMGADDDDDDDDEPFTTIDQEDNMNDDDEPPLEEEGEGEELINEDMMNDYRAIPQLDKYDERHIDDDDDLDDGISADARQAAERLMNKRDRETMSRQNRLNMNLYDEEGDGEEKEEYNERRRRRRRLAAERSAADGDADMAINYDIVIEDLDNRRGKTLQEWVEMDAPRKEYENRFKRFLQTFANENGQIVHREKIKKMCTRNEESLVVSYLHLVQDANSKILARDVIDAPSEILSIFDAAAQAVVFEMFPEYNKIHQEIHVRLADFPEVTTLRAVRQKQLNQIIRVSGVVTRRSGVFPQLKTVKFECEQCGEIIGPFMQFKSKDEIKVSLCPNCQSKGPFHLSVEQTVYRNYQKITLQESPGTVPAGRLPRHKEIVLLWDLVDSCKPGDEIDVTGVYLNNFDLNLNTRNGFPVYSTMMEANYIEKKDDIFAFANLQDEEIDKIQKLAKDPQVSQKIISSIAPAIYGHTDIKTGLALSLFGGEAKNPQGKHHVRGDINVLLMGDPGTAKSQFLKFVERTAPRAVFATGQGASAVGLTASVHKDPITREWTLEGGALVLADRGVCLIDEFDKMNDGDRTSIHEAMEQQSISISKAGIIATLHARCAVIAAANPIGGKYDSTMTFSDNVELTEPILSRFDVLCVVKDRVDPVSDAKLARFVLGSHHRHHPSNRDELVAANKAATDTVNVDAGDVLTMEFLRKYIQYARQKVRPKLQQIDQEKVANLYAELRRESLATGSVPITVRHIESIIRMSEAHARMHLRDYVRDDDVNLAIRVALESFISTQKYNVEKTLRKSFAKFITWNRDHNELLMYILQQLLREKLNFLQNRDGDEEMPKVVEIDIGDFEARASGLSIHAMEEFYASDMFTQNTFVHDGNRNKIVKTF